MDVERFGALDKLGLPCFDYQVPNEGRSRPPLAYRAVTLGCAFRLDTKQENTANCSKGFVDIIAIISFYIYYMYENIQQ